MDGQCIYNQRSHLNGRDKTIEIRRRKEPEMIKTRKTIKSPEISAIGIGSSMIHEMNAGEINDLLTLAEENGMNLLDLAMSYEEPMVHIGKALKGRRDKFFMQLHLGLVFNQGQYERTRDVSKVKDAFEKQLSMLEVDHVDIGCIHYVDDMDDFNKVFDSGVFEYAKALKRDGKIKYIGIASHVASICHKFIETGEIDFIMFSVNPAYDLNPVINLPFDEVDMKGITYQKAVDQRMTLYLECEQKGIGIIVMKALAGGILLDEKRSPLGRALSIQQCIKYALDRPGVIGCLLGFKSVAELGDVVDYDNLSDEVKNYESIMNSNAVNMNGICVYCNHCLPCPVELNIGQINKFCDLYKSGDQLAKQHYLEMEKHASQCISCGKCEKNCPFEVKIIERMKETVKLMGC